MSEKEALLPIIRICLQSILSLEVRKCAVPPEHLRSEISPRALATFQNIGKARKQEATLVKCVVCSYFHKISRYYKTS